MKKKINNLEHLKLRLMKKVAKLQNNSFIFKDDHGSQSHKHGCAATWTVCVKCCDCNCVSTLDSRQSSNTGQNPIFTMLLGVWVTSGNFAVESYAVEICGKDALINCTLRLMYLRHEI